MVSVHCYCIVLGVVQLDVNERRARSSAHISFHLAYVLFYFLNVEGSVGLLIQFGLVGSLAE